MKRKVFCIGLHKTGTSSLCDFAKKCNYKSIHTVSWIKKKEVLESYNFFSDGGSHFDNNNEFDFEWLMKRFPKALFILQTRDPKSWIVSKLKHAGWTSDTKIEQDDPAKLTNVTWMYKSFLHIEEFLKHKRNYEKKVEKYFTKNAPEKFLIVDVVNQKRRSSEVERLTHFLGLRKDMANEFPHSNKAANKGELSNEVLKFIDKRISEIW